MTSLLSGCGRGFEFQFKALSLLVLVSLLSCKKTEVSQNPSPHSIYNGSDQSNDRKALRKIEGMPPSSDSIDAILPWFWPRVEKLLGDSISSFQHAMSVEDAVIEKMGYVVLQGCRPHMCPDEFGKILIDTLDLKIHVSWQVDSITRKYSENMAGFPDSLVGDLWLKE